MAFWALVKNVGWSHFLAFGVKETSKIFLIVKQGSDSSNIY